VKIVGYGHVADGNLHLNVALKPDSPIELSHAISGSVYAFVKAHRGSISAEHGIGRDKLDRLSFSKSHESIEIMTKLKRMMDPNRILNPGRTLPW
jgi:D-2-hydroxyglutarate dehydrogenase